MNFRVSTHRALEVVLLAVPRWASRPTMPTRWPGQAFVFAQWNAAHGRPSGANVSVKKNSRSPKVSESFVETGGVAGSLSDALHQTGSGASASSVVAT